MRCLILALLLIASPAFAQTKMQGFTKMQGLTKMMTNSGFAAVTGTEKRCTDLGANCNGSEPMQSAFTMDVSSTTSDFTDSPDATEFPVGFFTTSRSGTAQIATVLLATAGASGWGNATYAVDHGYYDTAQGNAGVFYTPNYPNSTVFTSNHRSWCIRYYKQVSDVFRTAGGPDASCGGGTVRNKLAQVGFQASTGNVYQVQEDPSPSTCVDNPSQGGIVGGGTVGTGPSVDINNATVSPSVKFDDCVNKPCRVELCVDSATAFSSTGSKTFRTRIVSLATGTVGVLSQNNASVPAYSTSVWPWQVDTNHSSSYSGGALEAYLMSAVWDDVDANRWIGGAYEVEGNGCTNCGGN